MGSGSTPGRIPGRDGVAHGSAQSAVHKRAYSIMLIEDGSHTSHEYQRLLAQTGVTVSMSRKGNGSDNAARESFFGSLKGECVDLSCFQVRSEARQTVFAYLECFYNRVRRHSSLGYVSPVIFEQLKS